MQKYAVFLLCLGIAVTAQADPTADDFALQAGGIAGAVEACGQDISVFTERVREAIVAMTSNSADQMHAANLFGKSLNNALARQKGLTQAMSCTDILSTYNGLPLMQSDYKTVVLPALAANNSSTNSNSPAATSGTSANTAAATSSTPTSASTTQAPSAATEQTPPAAAQTTLPPTAAASATTSPDSDQAQVAANNANSDQGQSTSDDSSASDQLAQQQSMQNAMGYMQQQVQKNTNSPQMQQALANLNATPLQQQVTADSSIPPPPQTPVYSSNDDNYDNNDNMVMADNGNANNTVVAATPYINQAGGDNIAVNPSNASSSNGN